ncbi:MAG: hypothetical protein ABI854_03825 [Betaproteobacteria bacterium]
MNAHSMLAFAARLVVVAWALASAPLALATFHTYRIEQIYSNADGSIQFVVLKEAQGQNGQQFWASHQLISTRANGPEQAFVFPHNLPNEKTAGTHVLVGTAGFAALGIVSPDYILPNQFLSTAQGSVNFADVDFVAYPSLPVDGVTAIDSRKAAVPNVATNFAGQSASVTAAQAAGVENYEGLWWNSPPGSESGWGINFAHQGDVIFATWFTYDTTGKAWWLVMTADKTAPSTYAGTLYQTTGPAFDAVPFDAARVAATAVGTGTLQFSDGDHGTFAYTVNGTAQTKSITHQVFGALPTCTFGGQTDLTTATNYQDLWWKAPAGSEAGWGINFTQQGDVIFATWFTYGADGKPMWLSVTANRTATATFQGDLYRTTGPPFSAVPFAPAAVTATKVGSATLTFTSGNAGSFVYTVGSISQTKPIERQVFRPPGTVCR